MRLQIVLAVAASLAITSPALAQSSPSEDNLDVAPDWRKRPTSHDILMVYPVDALEKGVSGKAVVACIVTVHGTLNRCRIEGEEPAGMHFGAAAVALTPQMLMKPGMRDGKPVEATVRVPVNFTTSGRAEVPPGDRILANVRWLTAPTYEQVAEAYPKSAKGKRVAGFALLRCTFGGEGRLGSCDVAKEHPTGMGFGAAATTLRSHFTGPSETGERTTRGFVVDVPVTFATEMIDGGKPAIGRPQWVGLPTGEEVAAVTPPGPSPSGAKSARVVLSCKIAPDGGVAACAVVEETPANEGYSAAALKVAPRFRLSLWTSEGLPTIGGTVRVPMRFEIGPGGASGRP